MALPNSFSNNTSPTGPQLDANEAALGALTTIPCTVAGTNTLTLTPNANTPTVTAYANYSRFSGVAAATNSGATTARVGGLAVLPVYRDTPGGPVALAGNEIIINCAFTLIYDSTLNSGNGGFHLVSVANALPYTGTATNSSVAFVNGALSTLNISGGSINTPTLQIAGGAGAIRMLSTLATIVYTGLAANTSQSQPVTLPGASVNDAIWLGPPASVTTGLGFTGFVPASGTVSVRALNITAGSITAFTVVMRTMALGTA